jgi:hypothetical protein
MALAEQVDDVRAAAMDLFQANGEQSTTACQKIAQTHWQIRIFR